MSSELFWVNAFVGDGAGGNATGVVVLDAAPEPRFCEAAAQRLRVPDTAFLWPDGASFQVRFYSPFEGEMAFCGQGFIAALEVLRALGRAPAAGDLVLSGRTGEVALRRSSDGVCWFTVPDAAVKAGGLVADLGELDGGLDAFPQWVVDSGRRRVFVKLPDAAELETVTLQPVDVYRFCAERALSGVCFFARIARHRYALRVFTVSLAGGEDASTGGAVLGLSRALPSEPGELYTIEQGIGHALRRGRLYLKSDAGAVSVGGRVDVVARGAMIDARA